MVDVRPVCERCTCTYEDPPARIWHEDACPMAARGLLPEDNSEIRLVPDETRRVWEKRQAPSLTAKQRAAAAMDGLRAYRERRRRGGDR